MRLTMDGSPLMEKAKEIRPVLELAVLIGKLDDRPQIIHKLPIPGAFDKMNLQAEDIITRERCIGVPTFLSSQSDGHLIVCHFLV